MYFKLALRNVKRCASDYTAYFVTLTFAVCIFYVFNIILYKGLMNGLPLIIQNGLQDKFLYYISITSVIGAVIFGFLIICANSYIIKRRKKEFAIYMSLGMSKIKISLLLFGETLIIGFISLIVGIFIGVLFSQSMEAINAKLMAFTLSKYRFIFSEKALTKTLLYFAVMFMLVAVFNFLSSLNSRLIKLLNPLQESAKLEMVNVFRYLLMFLTSITAIGIGYFILIKNVISGIVVSFFASVILCGAGTILFFWALPVLAIKFVGTSKRIYFNGLNIFLLRQLNKRSISSAISMSAVCILLSLAICVLSAGVTLKDMLQSNVNLITPFDLSMSIKTIEDKTVSSILKERGCNINASSSKYIDFYEYGTTLTFKSMMAKEDYEYIKKYHYQSIDAKVTAISISDYNKLMNLQKLEKINLSSGEALIITNNNSYKSILDRYAVNNPSIKLNDTVYKLGAGAVKFQSLETTISPTDNITLVLPDETVKTLPPKRSILNMNYVGNKMESEKQIIDKLSKEQITSYSKLMSSEVNAGISTILFYICIFIALVLIIAGTVIMALQQLSEAVENIKRYDVLKKMGTDAKMINKSLLIQILICFIMPLLLVTAHSIVGMTVIAGELSTYENSSFFKSIFFTLITVVPIYFLYFIITYKGYKNIIHR